MTPLPLRFPLLLCSLVLAAALAGAGTAPVRAEAIHGSGVSCVPRTELLEAPSVRQTRDGSCYVTPRELARWRGGSELVVVDPRPAAEFRRARIPGAVNLPLRALPARPFLKTRRILLVDRGYLGDALEAGCRELRRAGFVSVGIVEGGLSAWAQIMGDLEGDRQARASVDRIPAREFARVTRYDHWLVVDVSSAITPDLERLLPGAVQVALGGDPTAFRQALGNAIGAREGNGRAPLFVAVVEASGNHYTEVSRALASLGVVHAFFLEGGLDGFRALAGASGEARRAELAGLPVCEDP